MRILLVSTYELGHQSFAVASAAAWLKRAGHDVSSVDTAIDPLTPEAVREVQVVAFHLPMHTATRLAVPLISKARNWNAGARLCCFGLYAPLNEAYLRSLGVEAVFGGECEPLLVDFAGGAGQVRPVSLERLSFVTPERGALPPLEVYSRVKVGAVAKLAGYTEASRGCKHRCRHCPVVAVYDGAFRVVQKDVVLADIRQQAAGGASHITFGDPDFFNGPKHALAIVQAMHHEFPEMTYDVTIKVEHLLRQAAHLSMLRDTGCLWITSAVESIDDAVLAKLEKGHTREDFLAVVENCRAVGIALAPTFLAFTPWTTIDSYRALLRILAELDLVENVAPVQLALRLLIPQQSRLLELEEVRECVTGYDEQALLWRWRHPDSAVDALAATALTIAVGQGSRRQIFERLWQAAGCGEHCVDPPNRVDRAAIPYLEEPWYC